MTEDTEKAKLKQLVEEQMERGNASKRAREVARIIIERDSCSTSDLEELGYKHSPRAVRDLRESGVELKTFTERYVDPVTGSSKRRARYRIVGIDPNRISRRQFSKKTTDAVKASGRCEACSAEGTLQVDHRVPFEIGGETYPHVVEELMPLCLSCNRTKSWTCEHCPNWAKRDVESCRTCMWSNPSKYEHIALAPVRELRAVLTEPDDIELFDRHKPNLQAVVSQWLHEKKTDANAKH